VARQHVGKVAQRTGIDLVGLGQHRPMDLAKARAWRGLIRATVMPASCSAHGPNFGQGRVINSLAGKLSVRTVYARATNLSAVCRAVHS
jgi:hypothetical protein